MRTSCVTLYLFSNQFDVQTFSVSSEISRLVNMKACVLLAVFLVFFPVGQVRNSGLNTWHVERYSDQRLLNEKGGEEQEQDEREEEKEDRRRELYT